MAKERPLGDRQRHVLWCMTHRNNGIWYPGCGWHWDNASTTIKIMDSLVTRGLVSYQERKGFRPGRGSYRYPEYRITDAGRSEAGDSGTLPAKKITET